MANEPFNFWNGKKADDLEGFVSCLGEISYEEFSSYVNGSKNDFANWIEHSLHNQDLAERIRPLIEMDLIRATVSNFISSQQNKFFIGTSNEVNEDSLVKEVIQKNEDFFKDTAKNENEEKSGEKNEAKGSKISLIDFPSFKKSNNKPNLDRKFENWLIQDFIAGVVFGVFIGALLTLILIQLL